jgi:hypothetical protein
MVQVKANEAILAVLGTLKERTEVIDDRGSVVGYFIPAESPDEQLRRKALADYSEEEYRNLKAASEGGERYTTEQVLERLRSLGAP